MEKELLELDLPQDGEDGLDTPDWKQVMKMMERGETERRKVIDACKTITEDYEDQGSVTPQVGKQFLKGTTMFSAHQRTVSRMRPLKSRVYLHGAPSVLEKIVTSALELGVQETGLLHALTGRFGAFHRFLLYGDSFIFGRKVEGENYPCVFDVVDVDNIHIDPFAVEILSPSSYQDADEFIIFFNYSYDEFVSRWGEKTGAMAGALPRTDREHEDNMQNSWEQESDKEDREIEVGYYFNKSLDKSCVFAGKKATIIEEGTLDFSDSDGKKMLGLFQLLCFPTPRGLFNWGLGHVLGRIPKTKRQFINAAISSAINRVDPILATRLSAKEQEELADKIIDAMEQRASGGTGVVTLDEKVGDNAQVKFTAIAGEQLTQDFERIINVLDQEILRMGINLDDIPQQTVDTATQATLREQSVNSFIQQILEVNGYTFKKMYEFILNAIKDHTEETNQYPLRLNEPFTEKELQQINELYGATLGREITEPRPTLGLVASILKKYKATVDVDLRSGAYPDIVSELARTKELTDIMGAVAPGSPAHFRMIKKLAKVSGESFEDEDLQPPQQPEMPQMPQG